MFYQKRPGDHTFEDYLTHGAKETRGYHIVSEHNGRTWSNPRDITNQILPEDDKQLPMFGPNTGILFDSERLVVPMYYADQSTGAFTPAVIFSDDSGIRGNGVQMQ